MMNSQNPILEIKKVEKYSWSDKPKTSPGFVILAEIIRAAEPDQCSANFVLILPNILKFRTLLFCKNCT